MPYWSDENKRYIWSLTGKQICFADIPSCGTISLRSMKENCDIILAYSESDNYYLAFYAPDYQRQKTTSVPKELKNDFRRNPRKLESIAIYPRTTKEHKIVYLPSNPNLIEQFFSDPDTWFEMDAQE